jgi:hypothetical protein
LIELRVNSGLCNRIRAMASALALSKAARQPLTVYWFNTTALNCSYTKLFEPLDGADVAEVETRRLLDLFSPGAWRLRAAGWRRPYDLFLSGDKLQELREAGVDLVSEVAKAKRCGIETYGRCYDALPSFQDFKPRPELLDEAERAFARATGGGGGRIVGVHIRRGDNEASVRVSPLDLFIARMQKEVEQDPEMRFFLTTDDPATEQEVLARFPGRVTVRDKDLSRTSASGVQDALVDLLVLSKCPLILGSYWSSFSQTAAELGGGVLEIVRTPK